MLAAFVIRPLSVRTRRVRAIARDHGSRVRNGRRLPPPSEIHPWLAFKRLTTLGFPRRFPIVQFPNVPLIAAFVAGEAGKFVGGTAHRLGSSTTSKHHDIWR